MALPVDGASDLAINTTKIPCWVEREQRVMYLPNSRSEVQRNRQLPLLSMTEDANAGIQNVILPISSDHLITLLQYRVLRGCLEIRQILSRTFVDEYQGSPEELHVCSYPKYSLTNMLPASLIPTSLQCSVAHHHWVDIIPHPTFRDNLIRALGTFNADDLWSDTVGGLFEGFPDLRVEEKGVVLWETPWHTRGWELSEGFVRKWGWALQGCEDLLEATNFWRLKRGEDALEHDIQP